MDLISILRMAFPYTATMASHAGRSLIVWIPLSLLLIVIMYFVASRAGWLATAGVAPRWVRIVYIAALLLLVFPLMCMVGMVNGVCSGVSEVLLTEVHKYNLTQPCGLVLVTPVVMGHLAVEAEQKQQTTDLPALAIAALEKKEVAFLLDSKLRERAVARLTQEFIKAALREAKLEQRFPDSKLLRWLLPYLEAKIAATVKAKMALYDSLFQHLQSAGQSSLSLSVVSQQVGDQFFESTVLAYVRGMFNMLRLQLIVLFMALWAITILLLRLACKWLARHAAGHTISTRLPAPIPPKNCACKPHTQASDR